MTKLTRRSLIASGATLLLGSRATAAGPAWVPPSPRIPSTAAGRKLRWALKHINEGTVELSTRDLDRHFAPSFLQALPAPDLLRVFRFSLAPNGPMSVARFEGPVTETRVKAVLITPGSDWRVTLGVDPNGTGINELFFEPLTTPAAPARRVTSVRDLERRLARLAPAVSFQAVEITPGGIEPLIEAEPETSLAVGSAFKLYVLGELANQIARGEAAWDELLAVRDDLRSLPSGEMRLLPAGLAFPLRHWAEQMIAVSDNTATDHLVERLGRERVEAAFAALGHATPERNVPLQLTREWFAIKLRLSPGEIRAFIAANLEEKRAMLSGRISREATTLLETEPWPGPIFIDTIGWFAAAADLCRVTSALFRLAGQPGLEPILGALSINPGIPFDARAWAYVGYKGGYETGVKSETWLLGRGDGRWFAMSAVLNDPRKETDIARLLQLATVTAAFLAGWQ